LIDSYPQPELFIVLFIIKLSLSANRALNNNHPSPLFIILRTQVMCSYL